MQQFGVMTIIQPGRVVDQPHRPAELLPASLELKHQWAIARRRAVDDDRIAAVMGKQQVSRFSIVPLPLLACSRAMT